MQKTLIILTVAAVCLSGCKKSTTPSQPTAKSGDAVQQKLQELAGRGATQSEPCPSQLRVAQSGRVTCFAPGTMGPGTHGGMPMAPTGAENPHGGMGLPPSGTPNPHAGKTAAPPPEKN
jgi:hypothetical protein